MKFKTEPGDLLRIDDGITEMEIEKSEDSICFSMQSKSLCSRDLTLMKLNFEKCNRLICFLQEHLQQQPNNLM